MVIGIIGIAVPNREAVDALQMIERAEDLGIPAVWMTTGGAGIDSMTLFAAAAARTKKVLLGTSIVPTFPRHPLVAVQQAQVIAQLAPGRFRLGLGPSHKATTESTYGFEFRAPLGHLREYLHIVKELLRNRVVEYDGDYYSAHAQIPASISDIPIMASALRARSFQLCGEEADGAISWVCPARYLRDVALPAMSRGAQNRGRLTPPLIAHAPVCVHEDLGEVRIAAREQIGNYPRQPFYARMLSDAGFPQAKYGNWTDTMVEAVVISGNESEVSEKLIEMLAWGAGEIIVSPIAAGSNPKSSIERTLRLVAALAKESNR